VPEEQSDDVLRGFGRRLRALRVQAGYSQEELAHRAQLDRTYVSGIERGNRNVALRNIVALASALEVEPAVLLREGDLEDSAPVLPTEYTYRSDPDFRIDCGFTVTATNVMSAVELTHAVMRSIPSHLFNTIDLKTQSGIVGAIFAAELATQVDAIPNPIEKGHPDVVPRSAQDASEEKLRNYPSGLEVKATIGNVQQGSGLEAGIERINVLTGLTWQAHHREVRSLMGLMWDFVGGTRSRVSHPSITGVFYSDRLEETDWGAISGTTGRNTKVTGMRVSGKRKMGEGAVVVVDADPFLSKYATCLGVQPFGRLRPQSTLRSD